MDAADQSKVPASSLPYTCNSCLVAFRSSDAQREHMRKDWHLYNMKRRVASLPPVSLETFNEKVLAAKATSTAAAAKASFEKSCAACQKTFYSENTYQNHLQSSKHRSREARMSKEHADDSSSVMSSTFSLGEPISNRRASQTSVSKVADNLKATTIKEEDENTSGEGEGESWASNCLFCNTPSSDIEANVDHMLKAHGMFIPERDFLVDLNGLIHYLYSKITENNECLCCHTIRNSTAAIRTHMRDKSHCMIAFETEEEQIEVGQFYDFRSTYSDDEDASGGSGGVKVSGSEEEGGDGWETETSVSSVDEDEDDEPTDKNKPVIYQSEYEMHLPSGRSIGHRSLAKYYRQNLHNYPSSEEREARQLAIENGEDTPEEQKPRGHDNHHRAVISRANGGVGMVGATDAQKHHAVKTERKERDRAIRQELRQRNRINRAANHQKHYRDPLLQ